MGRANDANRVVINVPYFTDQRMITYLTSSPADPILWPEATTFLQRAINIRLYEDVAKNEKFLCLMYNKVTPTSDGMGSLTVKATITGGQGQSLATFLCDGANECSVAGGRVMVYQHNIHFKKVNGACFGNLMDGRVKLEFTDMNAFVGIQFESPQGTRGTYLFTDATYPDGMSTNGFDPNGNSNDGKVTVYVNTNGLGPVS